MTLLWTVWCTLHTNMALHCIKNRHNMQLVRSLFLFRCSSHHLAIETGRWSNTPMAERICSYCKLTSNISVIEDEKHFLYDCSLYEDLRKKYFGDLVLVGDVCINVSSVVIRGMHGDWHCIYIMEWRKDYLPCHYDFVELWAERPCIPGIRNWNWKIDIYHHFSFLGITLNKWVWLNYIC